MHQLLPLEFANKRAKYMRHRLYAIAAKAIKTGRKVIIKCQAQYYQLLTKVLNNIKAFKPLLSWFRINNTKFKKQQYYK